MHYIGNPELNDPNIIFLVHGPKASPYEGYSFRINCTIPHNYPFVPPKLKFIDKPWSPVVDYHTGEICKFDILFDYWSPAFTIHHTVHSVVRSLVYKR